MTKCTNIFYNHNYIEIGHARAQEQEIFTWLNLPIHKNPINYTMKHPIKALGQHMASPIASAVKVVLFGLKLIFDISAMCKTASSLHVYADIESIGRNTIATIPIAGPYLLDIYAAAVTLLTSKKPDKTLPSLKAPPASPFIPIETPTEPAPPTTITKACRHVQFTKDTNYDPNKEGLAKQYLGSMRFRPSNRLTLDTLPIENFTEDQFVKAFCNDFTQLYSLDDASGVTFLAQNSIEFIETIFQKSLAEFHVMIKKDASLPIEKFTEVFRRNLEINKLKKDVAQLKLTKGSDEEVELDISNISNDVYLICVRLFPKIFESHDFINLLTEFIR